jgi:hypothetical protein
VDSVEREEAYTKLSLFSSKGYRNFNFGEQLYQLVMSRLPKTDTVSKRIDSYITQVDSLHLPDDGRQLMVGKAFYLF